MSENLTEYLEQWLRSGGCRIGQVSALPENGGGWSLMHIDDRAEEPVRSLEIFTQSGAARGIALYDAAGDYRPLKSAPNLRRGWKLRLPDVSAVRLALDFLYPAALGNWRRWVEGEVPRQSLRDMLNRQTGMYRVTGLVRDDEAQAAVAEVCEPHTKCLRKIVWPLSEGQPVTSLPPEKFAVPPPGGELPEMPVLCTDACPLLIGAIRDTVSRRRKAEREAAAAAAGDPPPPPAESSDSHSHSHSHA